MFSLRSWLVPRRHIRTFALLDEHGLCRAFRQSAQAPQGLDWTEVNQQQLGWLHKPLPASARIAPTATNSTAAEASLA
ncbi:hypothetical protein PH586_12860 [Pseudomonas sp. SA3-5]|uniref:Uncharacterized protein n=1 Tax=Pseudomonas aestuarii TaxID=3018340 RepID=A0ABT4XGG2_9PSED|nr:hypothetical protein [Pseudomonas aestuarii]MDA7087277.1 hypothetical protein [Pseudomonas aestuarii]